MKDLVRSLKEKVKIKNEAKLSLFEWMKKLEEEKDVVAHALDIV